MRPGEPVADICCSLHRGSAAVGAAVRSAAAINRSACGSILDIDDAPTSAATVYHKGISETPPYRYLKSGRAVVALNRARDLNSLS